MDVQGGVLDIKGDVADNTLWSCGYNSCVQRWDLRSGQCSITYEDPYDCVLYCLDHDYSNTLVAGCQMYGRVCLWDCRFPKCIQVSYFTHNRYKKYAFSYCNSNCLNFLSRLSSK